MRDYLTCYKGGKGATTVATQPTITPTPPIEEAGVDLDEETDANKTKTTRKSLKIPLTTASTTGLKV